MSKKKWGTPKLIVLVRGRPEEAVLTACKSATEVPPTGQTSSHAGCKLRRAGNCDQAVCSTLNGS